MENNKQHKSTLLTLIVAALVAEMIFGQQEFIYLAIGLAVIGLTSVKVTAFIHKVWMGLTKVLNLFIPKILLSAIYFFFLTPIAFLSRTLGKKDNLLIKQPYNTTFKTAKKDYLKTDFEKSW